MGKRAEWYRDGLRRCSGLHPDGEYLPVIAFRALPSSTVGDGLDTYCRACRQAADRRHYRKKRGYYIQKATDWKAANRARVRAGDRKRAHLNRRVLQLLREEATA